MRQNIKTHTQKWKWEAAAASAKMLLDFRMWDNRHRGAKTTLSFKNRLLETRSSEWRRLNISAMENICMFLFSGFNGIYEKKSVNVIFLKNICS